MKKLVSAVMAVFLAFSVMSVSVFAENNDVEAIKKALFEVIYKYEYSYDDKKLGIENMPGASYQYNVDIQNFLDQYDADKLAKIDADNWRDIDKLYKKYLDWYYDVDYTLEQNDEVATLTTSDGTVYTFQDNSDSWSLVDENGNEVRKLSKLTQFTYLNEEYQDDDDDETTENSSNEESYSDSSESPAQTRAAANAYEGQRASGKPSKDSSELTDISSEKQRATTSTTAPAEQDDSNIGIYVVLIVLIITTGVVIIVVNNNKNKNK